MPALALDWEAIKVSCIAIGIVATAERMGITDHLAALYQRSKRDGWLRDIPRSQPLPPSVSTVVSTVSTASQAMAASMREDAVKGRAAALKVTRRALERADRYDDDELMVPEVAGVIHSYVKSASTAGGYGAADAVARVDLRLTTDRRAMEGVIEAEVVAEPSGEFMG